MSTPVHDINPGNKKFVAVIAGASEILVTHRQTVTRYQTNRSIKTWATYFLLKSLTSSGLVQDWTAQKQKLLSYCKMTENSFRARLAELQQLKLATVQYNRSISLVSFENAAGILGIDYEGTIKIEYDENLPGKQIFQYFLRAEDMRSNQDRQLKALWYYAGKNPLIKDAITQMMIVQIGSDGKQLQKNISYFQQQLLVLQQRAFKEGSSLLDIIFTFRADINRSMLRMQDDHAYKSPQSVCYMKKVMKKMEIITIQKICVESEARARLYVPAQAGKARRDAYKFIKASKKTAWFLTDQVNFSFKTEPPKPRKNETKEKPAAMYQAAA